MNRDMNMENTNKSEQNCNIGQSILSDFMGTCFAKNLSVEYAQQCLLIYEETMRAMGLLSGQEISEAVDNSQLSYAETEIKEENYANFPECY